MTTLTLLEVVMEMGRLDQRIRQVEADQRDMRALNQRLRQRLASALADERRKSLDLYNQGVNGLPQEPVAPASGVDTASVGGRVGLAADCGDSLGEFAHDLAPSSLAGTESVGRSSASTTDLGAGEPRPRGAA